jgi:hypothetical protein
MASFKCAYELNCERFCFFWVVCIARRFCYIHKKGDTASEGPLEMKL